MSWKKPDLSPEEKQVVEELLKLSGGMACMTERSKLNEHQAEMIVALKSKGYVTLTKLNFMVVLPP